MEEISGNTTKWKSRAILVRCDDDHYNEILRLLKSMDYHIVYTRSSDLKLVVREEGW